MFYVNQPLIKLLVEKSKNKILEKKKFLWSQERRIEKERGERMIYWT